MFLRSSCCGHVIKELAHAFSCAYIELWMHLGSLESTQEARVALGCASSPDSIIAQCFQTSLSRDLARGGGG